MDTKEKVINPLMQFSIVALTGALVWFSFVYYPRVLGSYQTGNFIKKTIVPPAAATGTSFPVETEAYRLDYEAGSQTYYATVTGETLDAYTVNRDAARLSLKSILSLDSLCTLKIIYVSAAGFQVPDKFNKENCS